MLNKQKNKTTVSYFFVMIKLTLIHTPLRSFMRTFIQKEKLKLTTGLFFTAMVVLLLGMTRMGFFYAPILRFHALLTFIFFGLSGLTATYLWVKYASKLPPVFLFFSSNIAMTSLVFFMGPASRLWVIIPFGVLITFAGLKSIQRQKIIWAVLTLFLGGITTIFVAPSALYDILLILQMTVALLYVFQDIYYPKLMALFSLFLPVLFVMVFALLGSSQWHLDEAKWAEVQLYGAIPNETLLVTASLESVFIETSLRVNVYQKRGLGFVELIGQAEYLDQWRLPEINASTLDVTQLPDRTYEIKLDEFERPIIIEID
mgnify:CR=1 FL=1